MSATRIRWAQLASPRGECFDGFWVMRDGQPLNEKPLESKHDAQVFAGRIRTWADVSQFVALHNLPFKVIRFNMSNRAFLVDNASEFNGDDCASNVYTARDVYTAREVVLTCAYETFKIPVSLSSKQNVFY